MIPALCGHSGGDDSHKECRVVVTGPASNTCLRRVRLVVEEKNLHKSRVPKVATPVCSGNSSDKSNGCEASVSHTRFTDYPINADSGAIVQIREGCCRRSEHCGHASWRR